jgi:hypothetical protein
MIKRSILLGFFSMANVIVAQILRKKIILVLIPKKLMVIFLSATAARNANAIVRGISKQGNI